MTQTIWIFSVAHADHGRGFEVDQHIFLTIIFENLGAAFLLSYAGHIGKIPVRFRYRNDGIAINVPKIYFSAKSVMTSLAVSMQSWASFLDTGR